jgi:hypothetical protein
LLACGVAALGWFVQPVFAVALSALFAAVGVTSAILYSVWLIARRRRLDEAFWQRESARVAMLVVALILLVPANLVPTKGKRRVMKRQGSAAVRVIERHHRTHGSFPKDLDAAEGAPWYRGDLRYERDKDGYRLWFEDPGLYFLDSASWHWDRAAGRWKRVFERF